MYFAYENVIISLKVSLKFVPKLPMNTFPKLVKIRARRRPGDKPLSEAMMVSLQLDAYLRHSASMSQSCAYNWCTNNRISKFNFCIMHLKIWHMKFDMMQGWRFSIDITWTAKVLDTIIVVSCVSLAKNPHILQCCLIPMAMELLQSFSKPSKKCNIVKSKRGRYEWNRVLSLDNKIHQRNYPFHNYMFIPYPWGLVLTFGF